MMILQPKWTFDRKLEVITSVLSQQQKISAAAKHYSLPAPIIKSWVKDIYGNDTHHLQHTGEVILKDKNHVYIGFNPVATMMGSKSELQLGLTDFQITPEYANEYISLDQQSMTSKKKAEAVNDVYHKNFEWMQYKGISYPILDDDGEAAATVVICRMQANFKNLPFDAVMHTLIHGHASIFIQKSVYPFTHGGIKTTFTAREAECLLYLLVGLPNKLIGRYLKVSYKTVEKMISNLNLKLGVSCRSQLIKLLYQHDFLSRLV